MPTAKKAAAKKPTRKTAAKPTRKAAPKKKAASVDSAIRDDLVKLALCLVESIGSDAWGDPADISSIDDMDLPEDTDALMEQLKEEAAYVEPDDEITDADRALFAEFDIALKKSAKKATPAKKGGAKKGGAKKSVSKRAPSRISQAAQAFNKKSQTFDVLAEKTNNVHIKGGGTDNMKQSKHVLQIVINVLEAAGHIEKSGEGWKLA